MMRLESLRKVIAKLTSGCIIAHISDGKVVQIHQSESAAVLNSLVTRIMLSIEHSGSVINKTDLARQSSPSSTKFGIVFTIAKL